MRRELVEEAAVVRDEQQRAPVALERFDQRLCTSRGRGGWSARPSAAGWRASAAASPAPRAPARRPRARRCGLSTSSPENRNAPSTPRTKLCGLSGSQRPASLRGWCGACPACRRGAARSSRAPRCARASPSPASGVELAREDLQQRRLARAVQRRPPRCAGRASSLRVEPVVDHVVAVRLADALERRHLAPRARHLGEAEATRSSRSSCSCTSSSFASIFDRGSAPGAPCWPWRGSGR